MEIKIKESGKIEEITLIDNLSGLNWENDLLSNYNAAMEYDEDNDVYIMEQDEYDWWSDLVERYQAADNRYHNMLQKTDDYEGLQEHMFNMGTCDLENTPENMESLLDEWEKDHK